MKQFLLAGVLGMFVAGSAAAAPLLSYDPSDGSMILETGGETVTSLFITGPQPVSVQLTGFVGPNGSNGLQGDFWNSSYQGGALQIFDQFFDGTSETNPIDVATYATGLGALDFGFVEFGTPTAPIQGAVSIIPEPASLALLGLGGLAMIARRRSRA